MTARTTVTNLNMFDWMKSVAWFISKLMSCQVQILTAEELSVLLQVIAIQFFNPCWPTMATDSENAWVHFSRNCRRSS